VINLIDFAARDLMSNAGLFLLFENAKAIGIFDLIDADLVFDNEATNKIKMNRIKTMLCSHFIGINKLDSHKLLQDDPLANEFDVSVKEPQTVNYALEKTLKLVTIGAYHYIRHPLYVSLLILGAGASLKDVSTPATLLFEIEKACL
jgi:hypothetical protein